TSLVSSDNRHVPKGHRLAQRKGIVMRQAIISSIAALVLAGPCPAQVLSNLYTFDPLGSTANTAPGGNSDSLLPQPNGSGFASANLYGATPIGNTLGSSGRVMEPTSGTNNFAFWLNKNNVNSAGDWSILLWANRQSLSNIDMFF